jgi:hypothetical protein
MKIIERFGTNFVTRLLGLFVSPMPISEEQKKKCNKTFTAPVAVTYNDKGGKEKR